MTLHHLKVRDFWYLLKHFFSRLLIFFFEAMNFHPYSAIESQYFSSVAQSINYESLALVIRHPTVQIYVAYRSNEFFM